MIENMAQPSLKSKLLEIDFTPHESAVYVALLEKGPCNAGPLISATKLHRNVVYTALDHLIGKKVVSEQLVNGRKRFSTSSPATLVEAFEKKTLLAHEIAKEIHDRSKRELQEITIHQGNAEYLDVLTSTIKSMSRGSTKFVFGTGGEGFMKNTMLPIWKKYHEAAHAQHLHIRMLGYEPQRNAISPFASQEGIYEVRYLPANMENPAGLHIYPEIGVVLNIIYSDETSPVTAIRIRNHALAKGYLNLFENLWNMGKA